MRATIQKYISHPFQAAVVHTVFFLVALIPLDLASALGGWVARTFGPLTKVNKLAKDNLERAFPEKSAEEIQQILTGVWDNIGRTAFEIPHIPKINIYDQPDRFEIIGEEYINLLRDDGICGIFFSAHLANWEFLPRSVAQAIPPLPVDLIYRAPDNPWVGSIFEKRNPEGCGLIPKGIKGARMSMDHLKKGGHLALLVDQKMNDGIAVPFFGRDAMTAPAMAQFALRYKCPLVPVRIVRTKGANFKIIFTAPLDVIETDNRKDDILKIMTEVNQVIEGWVREHPDQWLWLHRRWPKD
ncbi:lysophospholipid acyltransferase family protein [Terasakiella pusilla]|uniref:lysophospholipid acyltransferase family protein n=1 Tax=Terasakiella pusilla TaxID=64973 RepID=UPI003AA987C6